jgi:hypothetical protein
MAHSLSWFRRFLCDWKRSRVPLVKKAKAQSPKVEILEDRTAPSSTTLFVPFPIPLDPPPAIISTSADVPIVQDMSYNVQPGQTIDTATDTTGNYPNVLAYDSDPYGNPLTVTAVNSDPTAIGKTMVLASGATLAMQAEGDFTYTSPPNAAGTDSFTCTISNGTQSAIENVTIAVTPDVPMVQDMSYPVQPGQTIDTATDTTGIYPNVLAYDSDPYGNPLTVTAVNGDPTAIGQIITLASGATLTMQAEGDFIYTATPNATGSDSFTCTISNGTQSATENVTIDVTPDVPMVQDMSYMVQPGQTIDTATDTTGNYPNVLAYDSDPYGSPLSVTAVNGDPTAIGQTITLASGATLAMQAEGDFIYTPAPNATGTDSFTCTISNGTQAATENVTIDVTTDVPIVAPWWGGPPLTPGTIYPGSAPASIGQSSPFALGNGLAGVGVPFNLTASESSPSTAASQHLFAAPVASPVQTESANAVVSVPSLAPVVQIVNHDVPPRPALPSSQGLEPVGNVAVGNLNVFSANAPVNVSPLNGLTVNANLTVQTQPIIPPWATYLAHLSDNPFDTLPEVNNSSDETPSPRSNPVDPPTNVSDADMTEEGNDSASFDESLKWIAS